MVERGRARMFDGTLGSVSGAGHTEIQAVAGRIRALIGLPRGT